MASILPQNIDHSIFYGTPVTVGVTAGNPANATFHRVRLVVDFINALGASLGTVLTFSQAT